MALFQEQSADIYNEYKPTNKIYNDNKEAFDELYARNNELRKKRQEEESLYVQNLISPERIKEWQDKGKMSALEVWNRKAKNELIPYMGTFKEGERAFKLKDISDRMRKGQYINPEEREMLDSFILDMAEIQTRGYSLGGGAMNLGLETLPFMAEFAFGLLTSGGSASLGSTSLKASAKAGVKGLKNAVVKKLTEKTGKEILGDIAKGTVKTAYNAALNPKTYAFTATRLPQQIYARMGDIQLSENVYVSQEGQAILKEAETTPAIAFMKALALTNIETASEMSGEMLVRPFMHGLGRIAAPKVLRKMAAEKLSKNFVQAAEQITKMPFVRAVDTLGWNTVLEEMGEERVGDLLKFAFNLDDKEGYTFEQFLDAAFPSTEELGQEYLAFAMTGAGMNALHKGIKSLPVAGEKYTKDGFLLDAGIFRTAGYDSLVDKRVKDILAKQRKSKEEIEQAVQFSSLEEKREFLKQNKMNLDDDIQQVQEDYKKNLISKGVSEQRADFASKIYAAFQTTRADRTERSLEELHAENTLLVQEYDGEYTTKNIDNENLNQLAQTAGAEQGEYADAQKEWSEKGTDSKYFKKWFKNSKVVDENGKPLIVYHGSPNEFEEFNSEKSLYGEVSKGFNFFTNKKSAYQNSAKDYAEFAGTNGFRRNGYVYETYLSIQKPLHIKYTSNGMSEKRYSTPVEYYDTNYKEIKEEYSKGDYDGIIIENTDKNNDDSVIYLVPDSNQIKSVDNRGAFDESNPNIYYQGAINPKDDINQRTDKTRYLTDNEAEQLEKDKENFETYIDKLIKGELSYRTQIRVLEKLTTAYNNIPDLKGRKVVITQDVYKKIIDLPNKFNKNHNIDRKRAIKLPQLIADPLYILKSHSEGNEHRFVIVTSSKSNMPAQRLSIILDPNNNAAVVSAYDEKINISEEKEAGRILYDKKKELSKTILTSKARAIDNSNNSITDNTDDFNPNNENNEVLLQEEEPEQQSVFPGNNQARNIRNVKGAYMPAEHLIALFKNADESTIVHEFAHWYLENLVNDAKYHEASKADLEEVRKFVHNFGEEFTREQHEKFARGFEAYIRSGRARTNRLKKVFEDFKNALLQIYDTITQIVYTENGIEKPFTEEDMPQINALFERILSTENERIQATVFDKVNEIDEKIKEIKDNQQNEFNELDTIYRDNIEILNRKSDKKRQVQEYLELAEKTSRREPKELKEWKKRYKEVTLDIIAAATGYNKKFIANPRNWEKVEETIAHVDDKITASNGWQQEWSEFYSDTGVSYENDETDGDYKLALQAFSVLTEGNYNKTYSDNYGFEEIENFTGQFDYLESKVKSLRGTEQQNAFEALSTLLFDKAPDMPEEVFKDFATRLIEVNSKVEDIQKDSFNRRTYPTLPVMQQLQFYVTDKLDKLKIYNPETRYKTRLDKSHGLYKQIKNAKSVNETKRIIQKINDFMIEDLRNSQRAILHKEIQKQIKINSKLVKVGSIRKGKFDWRTNTVFAELVDMNKLSQEEAEKQFDEILKFNEIEAGEERMDWHEKSSNWSSSVKSDFQDNLKRKFLQYKSSRLKSLDVSHTCSLLEDILKLKFEGRRAKTEEDFKKQTERFDYRNNLIDILDKHKQNKVAKFLANWVVGSGTLSNWETLLNTVFDADTAKKYSLQNLEAQTQVFARRKTLELINKANRIYGFENNKWDKMLDFDGMQKFIKLMQDYQNETYDYSEVTWNKETLETVKTGIKLSRAEIMTLYTWSLNDALMQRLNNQYGLEQLNDMFSRLSDKDKEMCREFVNICESMYDDMNEVYIATYGISLPKVQNYFPSVTERVGSDLDMFHDFVVKSSNPSFIKQRKVCNKIPMKPKSPLEILLPHINKSSNYIIMSETVNFFNKIFKETPLNKKIVDVFGKKDGDKIVRALQNQLSASTFTTVARGISFAHEWADNLATNFIVSSIAGSPKVMLGQLLSCINYAENMPASEWHKGFIKGLANPKATFKFMLDNCEYLQARLAGNTQNEMMSTLTSEVDRFRTIKNFCSLYTKYGDILAIIFGGKPYVDYLIKQGMTQEEAFKKFVDDTLRAQQAGLASTTSKWQKTQTKTAMGRAFFAFNNTNLQYERKFIDALSKLSKGDISTSQFAKSFLIYKVINPIMFTSFLGNLSLLELTRALIGDDEPEKAWQKFGVDLLLAVMLGSLGAYGIAGLIAIQLINYGVALVQKKIFDEKPHVFERKTPILDEVDMIGKKALKNEWTFADTVEVAGAVGNLGTGMPVARTLNTAVGIYNISQGEFGIGATRMLGYGEYKATSAWTGKPPEKDKKNKKK